ncbi:MAG: Trm112 family protein [Segniliparus sp.]|uniref:Trm112 family protein n=1 Tax=Segniliparus sp. TaxID=2804064 RepID=UPI003F2B47F7
MAIDAKLLEILACPQDHGPLLYVPDELLYNPRLHVAYPVEDGLPVLLADHARAVDGAEHEKILAAAQK